MNYYRVHIFYANQKKIKIFAGSSLVSWVLTLAGWEVGGVLAAAWLTPPAPRDTPDIPDMNASICNMHIDFQIKSHKMFTKV